MLAYYVGFGLSFVFYGIYMPYKTIKMLDEARDIRKQFED
jgi:hypothetical protein